MGKQAKKKVKTGSVNQQVHNKATRGINTHRRGVLWAIREVPIKEKGVLKKDKDGNAITRKVEIFVPPNVGWDIWDQAKNDPKKAQEPFDSLHLDWRAEMMEFAVDNDAKIGKTDLGDGTFLYRVYKEDKNSLRPDTVFFEVQSSKKFTLEREHRKRVRK